ALPEEGPPSAKALRDLRRRIGPAPLKALFEVLAGPVAVPSTPGVRFGRYRTVAFDGCTSIKVPDTDRNRGWLGEDESRARRDRLPGGRADDPGGDRHPRPDRRSVRPAGHRGDRLRPQTTAPAVIGHAGAGRPRL